jgi:hypothetical protein
VDLVAVPREGGAVFVWVFLVVVLFGVGKREEGAGVVGNQRTDREWVLVVGGGGKALVRHAGDDTNHQY